VLGGLAERAAFPLPPRIAAGDYLGRAAYGDLGLGPADVDVFWHYPDGNEERLQAFVACAAPAARLVLLGPDRRLRPRLPVEWSAAVASGPDEPPWTLLVCRARTGGVSDGG